MLQRCGQTITSLYKAYVQISEDKSQAPGKLHKSQAPGKLQMYREVFNTKNIAFPFPKIHLINAKNLKTLGNRLIRSKTNIISIGIQKLKHSKNVNETERITMHL